MKIHIQVKLRYILFLLLIALLSQTYGQSINEDINLVYPEPVGGKKVLLDSISYPDLARKAHIESAFIANISIDSSGTIKKISFKSLFSDSLQKLDSLFISYVKPRLHTVKWNPAYIDGKPISIDFSIPFVFILRSSKRQNYEFIKKDLPFGEIRIEPILINDSRAYISIN
jgi:hypothetical protein